MALGDLMPSSASPAIAAKSHVDELAQRTEENSSATDSSAATEEERDAGMMTSMAYLPHTVVLCGLRHDGFEDCVPSRPAENGIVSKWRLKDRMKTGCVALVLCLNIGVDPPDMIKSSPCARMECWIDPFSMAPSKALERIGKTLHEQYSRWQARTQYILQLDPSLEEVKKLCKTCRINAGSERVLFHYNGHGVPKPTANGEIWVFNERHTQYIPLRISDLDSWLKTPSIYVFDCSAAGMIFNSFLERQEWNPSRGYSSGKDCILLAACEAHEILPQSAAYPADVFTSCLTTPIKMALRWLCSRSLLRDFLDCSLIDRIPGRQDLRKTPLGELNWIFTAVTDTIAWNVLPHDLFQRLFRQDLLVASLFRNFLLAERIMRNANCSPLSYPVLPPTHQHHMWDAWDMAAELSLSRLTQMLADPSMEFQPSPFFTEQLTAFEMWLDHGSQQKKPPEQLPIVLQILLSHSLRFRALVLLGRFLDMGTWAVDLTLSVGIFPYVLKLLRTNVLELGQILVFIWTKILALDKSCQVDLVKDSGHSYFIKFLDSMDAHPEQRAMAAFVLAVIVDGHRRGQEACKESKLINICLRHLLLINRHEVQRDPLLLQWLCLCLGKLWEDYPEAQVTGLQIEAPAIVAPLLSEATPEVRASAVFALGALLAVGSDSLRDGYGVHDDCNDGEKTKVELNIINTLLQLITDGSPLVRAEAAVALARFSFGHNKHLKSVAAAYWKPQSNSMLNSLPTLANISSQNNGSANDGQYVQSGGSISSTVGTVVRVGSESISTNGAGRISSSSPIASSRIMPGSPVSDDSSQHSDCCMSSREDVSNGGIKYSTANSVDSTTYSKCVLAIFALAKDPSPRIASLGRRILSIIGIKQVVSKVAANFGTDTHQEGPSAPASSNLSGLTRSSSWLDMSHIPTRFRTPPVSPTTQNYLQSGLRRVCSLEFSPRQLDSLDSGVTDPLLSSGLPVVSESNSLPQSSIYNWSYGHFSRPLLRATDDDEEVMARRENREKVALDRIAKCQHSSVCRLNNQIASWDTKFETGTKAAVLLPFSPIVVAADENERIRVWNYEEATQLNSFDNHNSSDKGISKLCLMNELDDSMLLVASHDGNVRIWKDYTVRGKQKLVTAFSSIPGYRQGVQHANAAVDWQQQSGYLYASSELLPIHVWDLDKEQNICAIPSSSESNVSVLSASQVHEVRFAAGFADGSVRIFDVRAPYAAICSTRLHYRREGKVIGIGFQPGLDQSKIVSASQAGDIKFLDIRKPSEAYLSKDAYKGSLTALSVHRHAPIIAAGSSKQIIKIFNLQGEQLSIVKYYPTLMAQRIGSVSCLAFHPYRTLLAAGAADSYVSIYADQSYQAQ